MSDVENYCLVLVLYN